tara:strand:- start:6940 stop:7185 length:246 start_codon:yes stop_codon:yes gene_type:complete
MFGFVKNENVPLEINHRHGNHSPLYQWVSTFVETASSLIVMAVVPRTKEEETNFTRWEGLGRTPRSFVPPRPLTRPLVVQT